MNRVVEVAADPGGPDARLFRFEIEHLADDSGLPEEVLVEGTVSRGWIGNARLRKDRIHFYRGIAHGVLRGHQRPIIVVDWTEAGWGTRILAAAVPFSGRAVTIYAEAHPLRAYANPRVEAAFLRRLREIVPPGTKPIVVTDAGFRAPWIRRVLALGWDYLGRVRGRSKVRRLEG